MSYIVKYTNFNKCKNAHEIMILDSSALCDFKSEWKADTVYKKKHSSGWEIKACLEYDDYYSYVENFVAIHPVYGKITADLSKEIIAESKKAYEHFILHHPLKVFNFANI
jgi:hypothetical protein